MIEAENGKRTENQKNKLSYVMVKTEEKDLINIKIWKNSFVSLEL